ncbi:MAG: DUF4838 domain-containing protein [Armatimonadota bacterium]
MHTRISWRPLLTSLALLLGLAHAAAGFELTPQSSISLYSRLTDKATQTTLQAAGDFLAATLGQMTGWKLPVQVVTEPPAGGICLAVTGYDPEKPADLERYTITATEAQLTIASPTAIGVRHGVMAFLHSQGCRWLMPSPKWWIIPQVDALRVTGKWESAPVFASRRIWYAYGTGGRKDLQDYYNVWAQAGLLGAARPLSTGHSYGGIIDRNKAEFAQHPEYLAKGKDGKPDPTKVAAAQKFCYSNPGLRALCLRDRIALLKAERATNPLSYMVSMDPSDGQGTCDCAECAALGGTTERVLSLANHVARGLREEIPGAWVGLYAYSSHRMPPTIPLEPNIHIEVAMAFNQTGLTYDELIEQWGKKAGSIGIREYYGVEAWDWGLPGRLRGGDVAYHQRTIPNFLQHGAVSLNAETNANWGGQALGLYVAARMLWDPKVDVDAVVEEFLTAAYGTAAPRMRELYAYFDTFGMRSPALTEAERRKMLDLAFAALNATADPACKARIVDMLAYLVYVDHYTRFGKGENSTGDDAYYARLKALMTYAHRIESRNVMHTYALARRLCNGWVRNRMEFHLTNKDCVWKVGEQYTDEEIVAMAEKLRAAYAAEAGGA